MSTKREAKRTSPPAESSTSATSAAQQQQSHEPAVKRVKLDEGGVAASPSTLTSDPAEITPSSPVSSHVKSRDDRSSNDRQRGGSSGGGGSGGGRGKGRNARANNGKGKGKDRNKEIAEGKGKGKHNDAEDGVAASVNGTEGAQDDLEGASKLPKKKVAMLIGYSGLSYSGLQINPGVKTIEAEIFAACIKAGAVSEDNSDNPTKVSLMRAARTDAGVSAAINVLNLKLILNPPNKPADTTLEAYINTFLPETIRVWSIIRVQGSFHSRTMCDSRMYNYSLPTYCFLEPRPDTPMSKRVTRSEGERSWWDEHKSDVVPEAESATEVKTSGLPNGEDTSEQAADSTAGPSRFKEDQALRKAYRIPEDVLTRVRQTLDTFKGSHNFWNYTVGKEFADRSCQRIMKKLTVTEPFMVNDQEWISLKFHGQSFMLHQIVRQAATPTSLSEENTRLTTALRLFIEKDDCDRHLLRTHANASIVNTFGPARLNIPKAPALGLLLEQPHFDSYDKKVIDSNNRIQQRLQKLNKGNSEKSDQHDQQREEQEQDENLQLRDTIDYSTIAEKVEQFERTVILRSIYDEEGKDDTYALWLSLHDGQLGTDFDYLNAKGVIPQSAIIGKPKPAVPATATAKNSSSTVTDAQLVSNGTVGNSVSAGKVQDNALPLDDEDAQLASLNQGKGAAELDG